MADNSSYVPPEVWTWDSESGGTWASINKPTAGAAHEHTLPIGKHPLQLYSDAHLIRIDKSEQFGSDFVAINPNSKIPALMDHSADEPVPVFESGAILMYLAEKFGHFLPVEALSRTRVQQWLFWQMGSAPYLGGGFGHFYTYAP